MLGFDDYPDIAERLRTHRRRRAAPARTCRATGEPAAAAPAGPRRRRAPSIPGHAQSAPDLPHGIAPASGPRVMRRRLDGGPMAPLKLASGCDRRCSFCAIPSFRGSFVSRRPTEVLDEARWLADHGVRELFLVSENSTSYGKDLGDLRLLETLLPELAAVDGVRAGARLLPPARRDAPEPDRRDRRRRQEWPPTSTCRSSTPLHGCSARCGASVTPSASWRCSTRCGRRPRRPASAATSSSASRARPSRTSRCSCGFLEAARLDAVGVFGYSDEDGTDAADAARTAERGRDPGARRPRLEAGRGARLAARRGSVR